jgi:hypothetical protein
LVYFKEKMYMRSLVFREPSLIKKFVPFAE